MSGISVKSAAGWLRGLACVGALILLPGLAAAALQIETGEFTNVYSTRERLISYRHQERLWVTADGARHLLANLGGDTGDALHLMLRASNADDWVSDWSLPNTDRTSTADTLLVGNRLHMVYSDNSGRVGYARTDYDSVLGHWSAPQRALVYDAAEGVASAPTLTLDDQGRVWAVFSVSEIATGNTRLRMHYSQAPYSGWNEVGRRWGAANAEAAKAGRLIMTGGRVGLIYTDAAQESGGLTASLRWSELPSPAQPAIWLDALIQQTPVLDKDPFGTHFSSLNDEQGNLFLAWPVDGRLRYFRYDVGQRQWSLGRWLLPFATRTAYSQLARHPNGQVYAVFNVGSVLLAMVSLDQGVSFENKALLLHPNIGTLDWSRPRLETPSLFTDYLDVLQQVHAGPEDRGIEALYSFRLDP